MLLSQKTQELADKAKTMNDLAKAAKEVGATVKTSDLVGQTGQVPDFGEVGQVAPQLFDMTAGDDQRAHQREAAPAWWRSCCDKQEPSPDEIEKNFDQTRDQILEQRRSEAFEVFASNVINDYKKNNRVRVNAKAKTQIAGRVSASTIHGKIERPASRTEAGFSVSGGDQCRSEFHACGVLRR